MPSQDGQTYLVSTLDSHVRLMDMSTGKMLNDFTGHAVSSYRCRACFGHGEASVVCGDEKGTVWAWDLLDVCLLFIPRLVGSLTFELACPGRADAAEPSATSA